MDVLKKKFIEGLAKNQPQLLTKNLVGDVETPISCLLKIKKNQKYSFLLESVEGGSLRGRYSLLGCDPDIIWNCLLYTSPSPRDQRGSRMPSSA